MMNDVGIPLAVVDGLALPEAVRRVLRPNEAMPDHEGRLRRLPRFFYEVPSWEAANEITITSHFSLAELIRVDVREATPQRDFPRYVPLAVTMLAVHLQHFRTAIGEAVHVAANGGYRSPGHALSRHATPHCWGTAANVFRIGSELIDTRERIEKYAALVAERLPGAWARPFGRGVGFADDHLHIDLGYLCVVPRGAAGEVVPAPESAAAEPIEQEAGTA
jgi:hypothetical protein